MEFRILTDINNFLLNRSYFPESYDFSFETFIGSDEF